jgi:GAF domain-containing protein
VYFPSSYEALFHFIFVCFIQAVDLIMSEVRLQLQCQRVVVHLVDHEKNEMFIRQHLLLDPQMGLEPVINRNPRVKALVANANGLKFPVGRGLAGGVAQDGIMLHISSLAEGFEFDPEVDFVFDESITRNLLSCPIFDRYVVSFRFSEFLFWFWRLISFLFVCRNGDIVGVITAINKNGRADFSTDDDMLAESLSVHFGIMLSNCLSYEKEMAEVRKEHALKQLRSLIGFRDELPLMALCRRITELAKQEMRCDRASLFFVDTQRRELWSVPADDDSDCIFVPLDQGISGYVARTGVGVNSSNVYEDPRFYSTIDKNSGYRTKTMLSVPIFSHTHEIIAVLQVINKNNGAFTQEDSDLLVSFCSQAGIGINSAIIKEKTLYQQRLNDFTSEILRQTNANADWEDSLYYIVDCVKSLVDADICSLFLVNQERTMLSKFNIKTAELFSFPITVGIGGSVARTGEAVNIPDCYKDTRFSNFMDRKTGYHTHSMLCMPIMGADKQTLGVIQLINKISSVGKQVKKYRSVWGSFESSDEQIVTMMAVQASSVLTRHESNKRQLSLDKQNTTFLRLSKSVIDILELDELIGVMMNSARELLEGDASALFLVDRAARQLVKINASTGGAPVIRIPINAGLAGYVATTGQTLNINDVYEDPRFNQAIDKQTGYRTRSMICMPVFDRNRHVLAVAQVINKSKGVFNRDDEVLLEAFTHHAAVALMNSFLYSEVKNIRSSSEGLMAAIPNYVLSISNLGKVTSINQSDQTKPQTVGLEGSGLSLAPSPLVDIFCGRECRIGVESFSSLWPSEFNTQLLGDIRQCIDTGKAQRRFHYPIRRFASEDAATADDDGAEQVALINYFVVPKVPTELAHGIYLFIEDVSRESNSAGMVSKCLAQVEALTADRQSMQTALEASRSSNQKLQNDLQNLQAEMQKLRMKATQADIQGKIPKSPKEAVDERKIDSSFLLGEFSTGAVTAALQGVSARSMKRQSTAQALKMKQAASVNQLKRTDRGSIVPLSSHQRQNSETALSPRSNAVAGSIVSVTLVAADNTSGLTSQQRRSPSAPVLDQDEITQIKTPALYRQRTQTTQFLNSTADSGPSAPYYPLDMVTLTDVYTFDQFNSWGLDTVAMTNLQRIRMVVDIFHYFDLINTFTIPLPNLVSFICEISREYNPNPFHNFVHGFTVFHATYFTLANSEAQSILTPLDKLAMLVAAICHDVGHRGRTNAFEINTNSDLSLMYNDKSVLENYHTQLAFTVMQAEQNDIFCNLTRVQHRQARSLIISMILNTDMAYHFDLLAKFKARVADNRLATEPLNSESNADRQLLADMLVHSCDLSAPAKPFTIAQTWTMLCDQEFFAQTRAEEELGLPVSQHLVANDNTALGKRECGFIDFIIEPLWKIVIEALPELRSCYDNVAPNRQEWQKVVDGEVNIDRPYMLEPAPALALPPLSRRTSVIVSPPPTLSPTASRSNGIHVPTPPASAPGSRRASVSINLHAPAAPSAPSSRRPSINTNLRPISPAMGPHSPSHNPQSPTHMSHSPSYLSLRRASATASDRSLSPMLASAAPQTPHHLLQPSSPSIQEGDESAASPKPRRESLVSVNGSMTRVQADSNKSSTDASYARSSSLKSGQNVGGGAAGQPAGTDSETYARKSSLKSSSSAQDSFNRSSSLKSTVEQQEAFQRTSSIKSTGFAVGPAVPAAPASAQEVVRSTSIKFTNQVQQVDSSAYSRSNSLKGNEPAVGSKSPSQSGRNLTGPSNKSPKDNVSPRSTLRKIPSDVTQSPVSPFRRSSSLKITKQGDEPIVAMPSSPAKFSRATSLRMSVPAVLMYDMTVSSEPAAPAQPVDRSSARASVSSPSVPVPASPVAVAAPAGLAIPEISIDDSMASEKKKKKKKDKSADGGDGEADSLSVPLSGEEAQKKKKKRGSVQSVVSDTGAE